MVLTSPGQVNILLVDDQPAKLLTYEAMLGDLGENLIKVGSGREALRCLLSTDVALVLIDVCMPDIDGFELAKLIREHPRFRKTPLIFVSALQVSELDSLRGYEAGAVDYVPVPVEPRVLRAKVRVFVELHRKTRELESLNAELERRVEERTAALQATARRLQESERSRSLAMAAGEMGSWEWDLLTGEYRWDRGHCRICGVDPDHFHPAPESIAPLIHPEDLDRVRADGEMAARTGQAYHIEFRIIRPDGEVRWCVAGGAATRDESGALVRLSGVIHDITGRKRAEESLQHRNEVLEHLVEERTREREAALAQLFEAQKVETIGHLTGGVAHDFNNLLMAVLGSLELLKKRLPAEDQRSHRLLDNAAQGAERGAALTQRLLAFARRQELKPQAVSLPHLLQGMQDLLERAVGTEVEIQVSVVENLASAEVDANQLELALLNLAVNARDAMPAGGTLSIAVHEVVHEEGQAGEPPGLPSGEYVCITVIDTGSGMDEATLARATEPFFTTKGLGKGTGLGLSMIHGLASQSGGAMTVSSQVGRGTTVQLWLPKSGRAPEALLSVAPEEPGSEQAVHPTGQLMILLVDDDALVRGGTAEMLEDLGHAVVEVESGFQALEWLRAREGRVDLVITDHAMPGMSGSELIRRLRETDPLLPVLLASGYADMAEEEHAEDWPRLSKPFRQGELAVAVAHAIRRSEGPTANEAAA
ncbi:response regulator [uncultured Methylobacterium sp.]|uniref:response regulator n=1 Tax=uncultured Methylobacterium sp. TaxID=157278 RepID=UPI002594B3C2|nr:response regulator [uncultured Methylobacterium sp.]